jgi:hypothetical protein
MNKMVLEVILMTSTGWTELLGDGEFKNDDASTPIESSPPVGLSTYSVEELSSELELRGYAPPSSGLWRGHTNVPGTIENVTLPSGVPDWDLVPDVVLRQIVRDRDLFSIKDITDEAFFEEVTRRGVCQPSLEEFVDADIEREYWGRDLGAQEQEEEAGGWVFVFQPGVDTIKGFGLKIVKHALDLSGGASRRGSSQDASKLVGLTSNTVSAWAREHGWRDDPSKEDDSEE